MYEYELLIAKTLFLLQDRATTEVEVVWLSSQAHLKINMYVFYEQKRPEIANYNVIYG